MRLKYIELYNYQRLKNKGINRIKLTFTEIIQVIIGKNGGGKAQPLHSLVKVPGGWKRMDAMVAAQRYRTPAGGLAPHKTCTTCIFKTFNNIKFNSNKF